MREKHGGRRSVICIPKLKQPIDIQLATTVDRQLAYRIKRETLEKRNHMPRAQQNRIVSKHFYCIRISDILRAVEFDLAYGFLRLGLTLIATLDIGITQGSPLSPGLADLVLMVIEARNMTVFISEATRWRILVMRWVDDLFMAAVAFFKNSAPGIIRPSLRGAALVMADEKFDSIEKAYSTTGLVLKMENADMFAGITMVWKDSQLHTCQDFPQNALVARKFQNAFSSTPKSSKIGVVIGQYLGILDRASHQDFEETMARLSCHLLAAGYSFRIFESTFERVKGENPYLSTIFDSLLLTLKHHFYDTL